MASSILLFLGTAFVLSVRASSIASHARPLAINSLSNSLHRRDDGKHILDGQIPITAFDRPVPNAYLNDKTKPYWVDGGALPEVPFQIGESYSGLVPIDDTGKELFFWFVPSTNPLAKDEITIWLNGGPGCSSLIGFFQENGPVIWQPGTQGPVPNTWAWNNLTNMVFIEQPVSTGYSPGTPNITDEVDLAEQFLAFWKNYVDLFDLQDRKIYITGESYAGQYVPYISAAMLDKNDTQYFNLKGNLIYDPILGDADLSRQVTAGAFIRHHAPFFQFNDTFLAEIKNVSEVCYFETFREQALTFPPTDNLAVYPPNWLSPDCEIWNKIIDASSIINPCFNIYRIADTCPFTSDQMGVPYQDVYVEGEVNLPYFDRSDVKKALHVPDSTEWTECSEDDVFATPDRQGDQSEASALQGGPLQQVIEATNNVIIVHGDLDFVLLANGSLFALNNLTFNGQRGFSEPPVCPFYVPYHDEAFSGSVASSGVQGGYVSERGLTFIGVNAAGHEGPQYAPSASYRQLEVLLGRISSLQEVSGFTTQPDVEQSKGELGRGTWWPRDGGI
ncbi:serine carboxypeptidase like protein [Zymoseptoria brevis]|uniref:Carboxypeptidase n=1 Tax=Zymoseptoria brevis TaxID=1047168 RepID=A0A0F4GA73_9PEZI|nr:serine carboxypeptidase like protein [Zymoseptoria brevis]